MKKENAPTGAQCSTNFIGNYNYQNNQFPIGSRRLSRRKSCPLPPFGRRLAEAIKAGRAIREVRIHVGTANSWGDSFHVVRYMGDTGSSFGLTITPGKDLREFHWPVYGQDVSLWVAGIGIEPALEWADHLMNCGAMCCRLLYEDKSGELSMPVVHERPKR